MKKNPTGAEIAAFLGRTSDTVVIEQAEIMIPHVRAMAASYTRDIGFSEDDVVPDDLYSLLVARTARMTQNPLAYSSEASPGGLAFSDRAGDDWNRGEKRILDRYRKKMT